MILKKNIKQNRQSIVHHLTKHVENTARYYRKNELNKTHFCNNNDFISNILNNCINNIFSTLDNKRYYFKYEIYGGNIVEPYLMFLTKDELKKIAIFNINEKEYQNKIFGIRFEFIDPDANRYVFIITIE